MLGPSEGLEKGFDLLMLPGMNTFHFPTHSIRSLFATGILALCLTACSLTKLGGPSHTVAAADSTSLDELVFYSDWVGEAFIRPSLASKERGTIPVQFNRAIKDFKGLDEIEIPWPFGGSRASGADQPDSGSFFLLLRKGPDGRFAKPEIGRTAFPFDYAEKDSITHTYVRYQTGKGFPEVAYSRFGLEAFGQDSGIEHYKFENYLIESVVYGILTENDSVHYGYLEAHHSFQSNNADIILHYLALTGHLEMIGRFIAEGNDINFSDNNLLSPLWICMSEHSIPCMDTLMTYGANLNLITPDDKGRIKLTPIHAAVNLERKDALRWLHQNGAGLYYRDPDQQMPLQTAACSDSGILEILAYGNDSLSAKNREGKTALDLARACGNKKNEAFLVTALKRKPSTAQLCPRPDHTDPPHSGKSLFALSRKARIRIAGKTMYELVRLGCGLQGLEFGMSGEEAEKMCLTLVDNGESESALGSALAGTLGKTYTPQELDTLLVRYIQAAQGNTFPIWISKKLDPGLRELFEMRRQIQELMLKSMIEIMAGQKG